MQSGSGRFFIAGGTLPPDASSYVSRKADSALMEHLRDGEFCYVMTTRQMGKSSLMVRTGDRLRAEGRSVVMLDLTALGRNLTAEQWYGGLLSLLGEQLDLSDALEDYWLSHAWLGPMQRWMGALDHIVLTLLTGDLVIFVDEIDAVRGLSFSTDEFFAGIRACYNRRSVNPSYHRLTFCLLGVVSPSDLITETDLSPFNIGHRIELTDFTLEEAAPLGEGLSHGSEGKRLLEHVLYWTGGHPYMTQRLCRALAEALSNPLPDLRPPLPSLVDTLCARLFLSKAARDSDDNLIFVHNRLLKGEADSAAILDLYGQIWARKRVPYNETNPLHTIVHLSGIARLHEGVYEVRNRIYRQVFDRTWIQANMPGAELRRQQAAYRRGLAFASTGAAIIVTIISILALFSVKSRGRALRAEATAKSEKSRAEAETDYSHRLLYDSNLSFAQRQYEAREIEGARDLLEQSMPLPDKTDYRGFEWYYLDHLCHQDRLFPIGKTWMEHPICVSPDGRWIAAGEAHETIQLFDSATQQPGARLISSDALTGMAFSPDGKTLAAGSLNRHVLLWNLQTGRLEPLLSGHMAAVTSVAFHPNGKLLASGSNDGTVRLWDTHTLKGTGVLPAHVKRGVWTVAFSPDGKTLAAGCDDGTVRRWDTATWQLTTILKGHRWYVYSLAFAPDGQTLATGSGDTTVILWNLRTGQVQHILKAHTSYVYAVAFAPDGKALATAGWDRAIRLWDTATGIQRRIYWDTDRISSLSFLHDGHTLASTGPLPFLHLWDTHREVEGLTLPLDAGKSPVDSLAFSPNGTLLAVGSNNHSVQLWSTTTGRLLRKLREDQQGTPHVVFSPDGDRVSTDSDNGAVDVWEVATGRNLLNLPATGRARKCFFLRKEHSVLVLNEGEKDSGTIQEVNLSTGQRTTRFVGAIVNVGYSALSPDGTHLLMKTGDNRVDLWNAANGQELHTFDVNAFALAFSSDGRHAVIGENSGITRVYDTATGSKQLVLKRQGDRITSCAYSADDRRIVTGSFDQTVTVWDAVTGRELMTLHSPTGPVGSVAISPQEDGIASGSNGSVKLWQVLPP